MNASSPLFWSAQGGLFLQNVSDPRSADWSVQATGFLKMSRTAEAAVGSYVTAVVARDRLGEGLRRSETRAAGAVTAAYAPGPLVEAPPGLYRLGP